MEFTGTKGEVKIITVDPGHFHAALVQKTMYEQVSPDVCVYAPDGQDVMDHLERIKGFNSRPENPTSWQSKVYPGVDYLEKVLADKPGNVVVNNDPAEDTLLQIVLWVDAGGTTSTITYTLVDGTLQRDRDDELTFVADNIRPKESGVTQCHWDNSTQVLTVTITAEVFTESETRTFEVRARPDPSS